MTNALGKFIEMVAVTGEVFLEDQALAHLPKCLEVLKKAAMIFYFLFILCFVYFGLRIGDRYREVVRNKTNIKLLEKNFLTF